MKSGPYDPTPRATLEREFAHFLALAEEGKRNLRRLLAAANHHKVTS